MEIDLSQLRAIERDKEIPFDYLIKALEEALLNAYLKTEDAHPGARVALDRRSGRVAVMVPELDDEGNVAGEYDDTPSDFGRVAAATARQVIFQRLREHEDEQKFGRFQASEGDILTGVIKIATGQVLAFVKEGDTRTTRIEISDIADFEI